MLSTKAFYSLKELRHTLHQHPELSGQESATIERLKTYISNTTPEATFVEAGKGLLVIFQGDEDGPTTLIRAELDALPIDEQNSPKTSLKAKITA